MKIPLLSFNTLYREHSTRVFSVRDCNHRDPLSRTGIHLLALTRTRKRYVLTVRNTDTHTHTHTRRYVRTHTWVATEKLKIH